MYIYIYIYTCTYYIYTHTYIHTYIYNSYTPTIATHVMYLVAVRLTLRTQDKSTTTLTTT